MIDYRNTFVTVLKNVKEDGHSMTARRLFEAFRKHHCDLKDNSLDYGWRGNGNKARRRLGQTCRPFRCYCDHSPCRHENSYGTYVWSDEHND